MKALLGGANFGLLPFPSIPARCRDGRPIIIEETGSQQFAPHRSEMPEGVTTTHKPCEQQDGARHKPSRARALDGRMPGVAIMLMVALLLIAGVVASVRADRCSASTVTIRLND
jgi:hypothetical protein